MTLQDILKAKGLTDEDIQVVVADMKQSKIFTAGEENLDIRYGKLKGEYDALKAQSNPEESKAAVSQLAQI